MELDPKEEDRLHEESATVDSGADAPSLLDSLEGQESDTLVYRNDTRFRELLQHFQNAQWEDCVGKINQLLNTYPEDNYLLAFKQDVEIRVRQQKSSKERQAKDHAKKRQKVAIRTLSIIAVGLLVVVLIVAAANSYRTRRSEQAAALTAAALVAQDELANNFMQGGKPEEALRLYQEIQRIDPSYQDIDRKIDVAEQAVTVAELYEQGLQAFQAGKNEQALELFLNVEQLHPKYRDTPQLIQKIRDEEQVAALVSDIHAAYSQGDWATVVHNYETIQAMAPSSQLPDLREILFVSYRELILQIAGNPNLTPDDLETAEAYYRRALALFPQDKEHAGQRDELQAIAAELLANKYFLNGMSLLESSNYSVEGLEEAIRILTRASNIGPDSPAITEEIEKANLFLDSYDNLLHQRWDQAIVGFEALYRKEEDYAGGRVKYFLYEAHTARGDKLFAFADFASAFVDYQEAEKLAWGDQGNPLRLFQVETRIAATLRKLGRMDEAAEYYHYAFELLGYQKRLTGSEDQELLGTITQADLAYQQGDDMSAVRLYELAMGHEEELFDQRTISVNEGDTLANIAFQNGTTIERLRVANRLGESMIILKDQEFRFPVISAEGP